MRRPARIAIWSVLLCVSIAPSRLAWGRAPASTPRPAPVATARRAPLPPPRTPHVAARPFVAARPLVPVRTPAVTARTPFIAARSSLAKSAVGRRSVSSIGGPAEYDAKRGAVIGTSMAHKR
jgi:hypothetical protein